MVRLGAVFLALLIAGGVAARDASAECVAPPVQSAEERRAQDPEVRIRLDGVGRAVAPVYVNDQGPFRFVVDTGANRSVLSLDLAARLGVASHGEGEVHSIEGVRIAPFARVRTISAGALRMRDVDMPLLSGDVLAGQQGFLGVDGLVGRWLYMDFEHRCIEITEADAPPALTGWIAVPGRLQYGSSFVMTGHVRGVAVTILIDTGSNVTLANSAFREALRGDRATVVNRSGDFLYTAGRPIVTEGLVWTPHIRLGEAEISNVVAYIGDFHVFELWGLNDRPTVLIGMDVLARARGMAIDYARGVVYFRRAPGGRWSSTSAAIAR